MFCAFAEWRRDVFALEAESMNICSCDQAQLHRADSLTHKKAAAHMFGPCEEGLEGVCWTLPQIVRQALKSGVFWHSRTDSLYPFATLSGCNVKCDLVSLRIK